MWDLFCRLNKGGGLVKGILNLNFNFKLWVIVIKNFNDNRIVEFNNFLLFVLKFVFKIIIY